MIATLMFLGSVVPVSASSGKSNQSPLFKNTKLEAVSLDGMEKPAIDITLGNKLPLTGYFTRNVTVNDDTRTVKIYVAPDTTVRDYFTVVAAPEGMSTEEFLQKTDWIDIANKKSEGLFILEPGESGWGSAEEELDYINQAFNVIRDTTYYNTFGLFYLAGYGDGGSALQAWAMENPHFVISSAFIQTEDLDSNFIAKTGAKTFSENQDISYSEVPVPTWFVNDDLSSVENLVDYWKQANDTVEEGIKSKGLLGGTVFTQDQSSENIVTSYSDVLSQVAILEKDDKSVYTKGFTKKVYEFLSYYTRYDSTSINGNVLGVRPDHEAIGVEYKEMNLGGYTREYLVYIPESAPNENIPAVFVLAGNTQPARLFFDASHWWDVADKYGFMLVMPSEQYNSSTELTWNVNFRDHQQDDFVFLEEVIKQVDKDYSIDPGKRYLTGQSLGSMFTNYATAIMPEYFAAVGSTSGPLLREVEGKTDKIPNYLIFGEYDLWSWDHTVPGRTNNTVNYWLDRNDLGDIDDAVVTSEDRYKTYTWYDDSDIPMYQYTQTSGRAHNFIVSEVWKLWEDWFSHWEMDEEGERHYNNKAEEPEETEGIVSTQAITDMKLLGQKLAAVAIEYESVVDSSSLSTQSYEIMDLDSSGETMATAEISKVYTNNKPEMRTDGKSVPGKYVIVEIADSSRVGIMMTDYVYYDENGQKQVQPYWLKKDVNTTVQQLEDILAKNGKVISKASTSEMGMTKETVQLKYDEFEDLLTIPSSSGEDHIMVKYRLPKNYNPAKKYPIMMSLTGMGTSFWQVNGEDNFGTSIAIDKSATAWMEEEDMIIVSTHYRSSVPQSMQDTYSASDDIIATYEYFIENFSVDTDRVYLTGNSMGTAKSFEVLMKRPDLVSAFIVANGAVNPGPRAYPDSRKDELKEELAEVADAGVAIWFHHGLNDRSITIQRAQTAYQALLELHEENGRSQEWIEEHLKFTTYSNEDFIVDGLDIGPPIYHSATKLAYEISFNSSWEDRLPDGERGIGIREWVKSK